MKFPEIPKEILAFGGPGFAPSRELDEWARKSFIDPGSSLENKDHVHLRLANILWVWAAAPAKLRGTVVAGTAECYKPNEGTWTTRRASELIKNWNGGVYPDFVITLSATYIREASSEAICALVEHELYHCGHAKDTFGFPKYDKRGLPVFCSRPHDVEEFVGVVARYGAITLDMQAMASALQKAPTVARKSSEVTVCGCGAKLARI